MAPNMRVLWVSSVCPHPATDGNRQRQLNLLRWVAERHSVSLVAPVEPEESSSVPALSDMCDAVAPVAARRNPSGARSRIRAARRRMPDCIVPGAIDELCAKARALAQQNQFDVAFGPVAVAPALLAAGAGGRVIDDHDAQAEAYRRLWRAETPGARKVARWHDWRSVRAFERRWIPRADAVTISSAGDLAVLERLVDEMPPATVVPNGVDVEAVRFRDGPRDPATLLFVGGMSYPPNVHAAQELVRDVMPRLWTQRPDARLLLVGKEPAPDVRRLAGPRVTVTGAVPSVEAYLARATASVVPLRSGGGTRLKILEAMAAGVPVVTTAVGAEGLDLEAARDVLIAETPDELAAATLELLENGDRRREIAHAARRRVERDFHWGPIAERLVGVLEAVAARPRRS
jgi:polysaccharide biosynthesis protein PslH